MLIKFSVIYAAFLKMRYCSPKAPIRIPNLEKQRNASSRLPRRPCLDPNTIRAEPLWLKHGSQLQIQSYFKASI